VVDALVTRMRGSHRIPRKIRRGFLILLLRKYLAPGLLESVFCMPIAIATAAAGEQCSAAECCKDQERSGRRRMNEVASSRRAGISDDLRPLPRDMGCNDSVQVRGWMGLPGASGMLLAKHRELYE